MSHSKIRIVVACAIGVPGTILVGSLAAFAVILGIGSLLISPNPQSTPPPSWEHAAVMIIWGVAGVLGLIGFWAWVLSHRPLSRNRRRIIDSSVIVGVVAAAPLVISDTLYGVLAFLGCLAGIGILIDGHQSNPLLNPDARQETPRAG